MIEKIPGENTTVYKYREKSAATEQFELLKNSQVEPGISENTGVIKNSIQQDLLIISPDYQAVKNLTEIAAEQADKIQKISTAQLSEVRRKVQDGFYLKNEVLTAAAEQIIASEFSSYSV